MGLRGNAPFVQLLTLFGVFDAELPSFGEDLLRHLHGGLVDPSRHVGTPAHLIPLIPGVLVEVPAETITEHVLHPNRVAHVGWDIVGRSRLISLRSRLNRWNWWWGWSLGLLDHLRFDHGCQVNAWHGRLPRPTVAKLAKIRSSRAEVPAMVDEGIRGELVVCLVGFEGCPLTGEDVQPIFVSCPASGARMPT